MRGCVAYDFLFIVELGVTVVFGRHSSRLFFLPLLRPDGEAKIGRWEIQRREDPKKGDQKEVCWFL
jgi:hypothetical protein